MSLSELKRDLDNISKNTIKLFDENKNLLEKYQQRVLDPDYLLERTDKTNDERDIKGLIFAYEIIRDALIRITQKGMSPKTERIKEIQHEATDLKGKCNKLLKQELDLFKMRDNLAIHLLYLQKWKTFFKKRGDYPASAKRVYWVKQGKKGFKNFMENINHYIWEAKQKLPDLSGVREKGGRGLDYLKKGAQNLYEIDYGDDEPKPEIKFFNFIYNVLPDLIRSYYPEKSVEYIKGIPPTLLSPFQPLIGYIKEPILTAIKYPSKKVEELNKYIEDVESPPIAPEKPASLMEETIKNGDIRFYVKLDLRRRKKYLKEGINILKSCH